MTASTNSQTPYEEAQRYFSNAREQYQKAGKEGKFYIDSKYVKSGAHFAYLGMLIALDEWLQRKGVPAPAKNRKDITWYQREVGQRDKKLVSKLDIAYKSLHLAGSYDGNPSVALNQEGLQLAEEIAKLIE